MFSWSMLTQTDRTNVDSVRFWWASLAYHEHPQGSRLNQEMHATQTNRRWHILVCANVTIPANMMTASRQVMPCLCILNGGSVSFRCPGKPCVFQWPLFKTVFHLLEWNHWISFFPGGLWTHFQPRLRGHSTDIFDGRSGHHTVNIYFGDEGEHFVSFPVIVKLKVACTFQKVHY